MEKRINKNVFTWVGTFMVGVLGADRFMRGQIVLGILKLITLGGMGVWALTDWIIALTKLGQYDKDFVFVGGKWSIGNSVNSNVSIAPTSGESVPKKKVGVIPAIIAVIIAIIVAWYFLGGGLEQQAASDLKKIEVQVARDAEKQYQIAVDAGSDMDAYVQAGLVAAAYLQANDSENYKKWKEIEKQWAKKVGLDF
jgi:TM2 domain-containing membrane protein YozV